jgi:hypothetical protein
MSEGSFVRRLTPWALLLALAAPAGWLASPACAVRRASVAPLGPSGLSAPEFASLVQGLSEPGGYFHSDNFTSNETSYLHVVDALRELGVEGGAYVGVGPEQNFTYIARVRPRLAFIVDIRRQAMLQHLLYKALFQLAKDRAEFLSLLFSRPLPQSTSSERASIQTLLASLENTEPSAEAYSANGDLVRRLVEEDLQVPLSAQDRQQLHYVYSSFRDEGLAIGFRFGSSNWAGGRRFPDFKDLVLEHDLRGQLGHFLASEDDYQFVRGLQLQNRIVPIVGDFAGKHALSAVGDELRRRGLSVSAFYTSNVEQFLFQNGVFPAFVENVRRLPIDDKSVFIRAVPSRGQPHPALVSGHRTVTLLQKLQVFLADYDAGLHTDYRALVTTHFIAGQAP